MGATTCHQDRSAITANRLSQTFSTLTVSSSTPRMTNLDDVRSIRWRMASAGIERGRELGRCNARLSRLRIPPGSCWSTVTTLCAKRYRVVLYDWQRLSRRAGCASSESRPYVVVLDAHAQLGLQPRTYVAGLFDTPNIEPAVPVLMPAADCLRVHIRLNGEPLQLRLDHMLSHCRTLDMRRGLLTVDWHQRDASGIVVRVRSLRLVS